MALLVSTVPSWVALSVDYNAAPFAQPFTRRRVTLSDTCRDPSSLSCPVCYGANGNPRPQRFCIPRLYIDRVCETVAAIAGHHAQQAAERKIEELARATVSSLYTDICSCPCLM